MGGIRPCRGALFGRWFPSSLPDHLFSPSTSWAYSPLIPAPPPFVPSTVFIFWGRRRHVHGLVNRIGVRPSVPPRATSNPPRRGMWWAPATCPSLRLTYLTGCQVLPASYVPQRRPRTESPSAAATANRRFRRRKRITPAWCPWWSTTPSNIGVPFRRRRAPPVAAATARPATTPSCRAAPSPARLHTQAFPAGAVLIRPSPPALTLFFLPAAPPAASRLSDGAGIARRQSRMNAAVYPSPFQPPSSAPASGRRRLQPARC